MIVPWLRNHDIIITSQWRHYGVIKMSLLRNYYVFVQLDVGSEEKVMLQSHDEQNIILVTYKDLKKALNKVSVQT